MANESAYITEQQSNLPVMEGVGKIVTVEEYYGISDDITKGQFATKKTTERGKISFEKFVEENQSENIFDNDVSSCSS